MATIRCLEHTFTNIHAIIFDKDGTLANVDSYLLKLGQKRSHLLAAQIPGIQKPLLKTFGIEETFLNPDGLLAVGSRLENKIAAAAYVAATGRNWSDVLEVVELAFCEADSALNRKAEYTPLFTNTLQILTTLNTSGLKLGLLSADSGKNVQDFLAYNQLQPFFQAAMGVDGTISKPDPSLYIEICAQLDIDPRHTLMIGDSQVDMKMAKAAKAAGCVRVSWGQPPSPFVGLADVTLENWQQFQVFP